MGNDFKENTIIPTLLAGAAVYFGLTRNSDKLGDVTKTVVSRLVDDQVSRNGKKRTLPANKQVQIKKSKHYRSKKIRPQDLQK
jgi:hypothetical protein